MKHFFTNKLFPQVQVPLLPLNQACVLEFMDRTLTANSLNSISWPGLILLIKMSSSTGPGAAIFSACVYKQFKWRLQQAGGQPSSQPE